MRKCEVSCSIAVPVCVVLGVLSRLSDLHFIFTSAYVVGSPVESKSASIRELAQGQPLPFSLHPAPCSTRPSLRKWEEQEHAREVVFGVFF